MSVQSWWRGVTVADPVFTERAHGAVRSAVFLASMVLGSSALAQSYDVVLQGGRVMDPETGLDATRNVGISKGKIARISADALAGRRVIDVRGLVVAPGFIDLHQHAQDADSGRLHDTRRRHSVEWTLQGALLYSAACLSAYSKRERRRTA